MHLKLAVAYAWLELYREIEGDTVTTPNTLALDHLLAIRAAISLALTTPGIVRGRDRLAEAYQYLNDDQPIALLLNGFVDGSGGLQPEGTGILCGTCQQRFGTYPEFTAHIGNPTSANELIASPQAERKHLNMGDVVRSLANAIDRSDKDTEALLTHEALEPFFSRHPQLNVDIQLLAIAMYNEGRKRVKSAPVPAERLARLAEIRSHKADGYERAAKGQGMAAAMVTMLNDIGYLLTFHTEGYAESEEAKEPQNPVESRLLAIAKAGYLAHLSACQTCAAGPPLCLLGQKLSVFPEGDAEQKSPCPNFICLHECHWGVKCSVTDCGCIGIPGGLSIAEAEAWSKATGSNEGARREAINAFALSKVCKARTAHLVAAAAWENAKRLSGGHRAGVETCPGCSDATKKARTVTALANDATKAAPANPRAFHAVSAALLAATMNLPAEAAAAHRRAAAAYDEQGDEPADPAVERANINHNRRECGQQLDEALAGLLSKGLIKEETPERRPLDTLTARDLAALTSIIDETITDGYQCSEHCPLRHPWEFSASSSKARTELRGQFIDAVLSKIVSTAAPGVEGVKTNGQV